MSKSARWLGLALVLLAGCTTGDHTRSINMDALREYREAKLAAEMRARLVVTVSAQTSGKDNGGSALHDVFRTEGERLGRLVGVRLVEHYPLESLGLWVYVYEAGSERALERAFRLLKKQPAIEDVQRVNLYRTQSIASARDVPAGDPLAPLQAIPLAELEQLHEVATGRGVVIAVIDTGIDLAHEDLEGAALEALDMIGDEATIPVESHATAVTGLILAQSDNGIGIRGIAPDARVIVLRACWQMSGSEGAFCNTFTLAKAIAAAQEAGADIVNLSLTGPMDPLLVRLVRELLANDIVVVAANRDEPGQGAFPGGLPGVIAATARPVLAGQPGPVYAPGNEVLTLLPGNRYGLQDGSSISAAQVSAVASLFLERHPAMSAAAIEAVLHGQGVEAEGLEGLLEALHRARP